MTAEQYVRRLYDAVNTKDLETIASYGCVESQWLDVPFNYLATGERAIVDPWNAWFGYFPDASCEIRNLVAMGNHVVVQGIGRGTHLGAFDSPAGRLEPTGRVMEVHFCDVYHLAGDKILRADSYFDFYDLLRRLAPEKLPSAVAAD